MRCAESLTHRLLSPSFGYPVVLHVMPGPPFGMRARQRDARSVRLTHGLQPRARALGALVTNNPKGYRHLDKLQIVFVAAE
jgi:hypothetical protein